MTTAATPLPGAVAQEGDQQQDQDDPRHRSASSCLGVQRWATGREPAAAATAALMGRPDPALPEPDSLGLPTTAVSPVTRPARPSPCSACAVPSVPPGPDGRSSQVEEGRQHPAEESRDDGHGDGADHSAPKALDLEAGEKAAGNQQDDCRDDEVDNRAHQA